jgi:hypothetical protein
VQQAKILHDENSALGREGFLGETRTKKDVPDSASFSRKKH